MSRKKNHTVEREELIRRALEGELTPEDRRYLEEHPEVAAEIREIEQLRILLTRAVESTGVPDRLVASVRGTTLDAPESDRTDRLTGRLTGRFWIYGAAAAIALTVAIWGTIRLVERDLPGERPVAAAGVTDSGVADSGTSAAGTVVPVPDILQVGMTDHIRCAVSFFDSDVPPMPPEEMATSLGEDFEELIPIVEQRIDVADLVVSHRCTFNRREYVHLVLKSRQGVLISIAITERLPGERLEGRSSADTVVAGQTVFRTEIDGFEIAGFESGDHLVFLASNLSVEENLRAFARIIAPVDRLLTL